MPPSLPPRGGRAGPCQGILMSMKTPMTQTEALELTAAMARHNQAFDKREAERLIIYKRAVEAHFYTDERSDNEGTPRH